MRRVTKISRETHAGRNKMKPKATQAGSFECQGTEQWNHLTHARNIVANTAGSVASSVYGSVQSHILGFGDGRGKFNALIAIQPRRKIRTTSVRFQAVECSI